MIERIATLWPELILFVTTCVVMIVGLSRSAGVRRGMPMIAGLGLVLAGVAAIAGADAAGASSKALMPMLAVYGKVLVAVVGLMLLALMSGVADREYEDAVASGRAKFDPLRSNSAEFYSFYLFSLTGLMLCAGADDLIWLFLALELTSLPTYVMVTLSSSRRRSMEAGVKYFFLGALGAAIFLYGFVMLYGATGHTDLLGIRDELARQAADGGLNVLASIGLVLSAVGLFFKIAAVPMHFYTADVYQGAQSSVSAMLAFVPKTAGFFALLLICSAVGWGHGADGRTLPEALHAVLWAGAVLTMTVGNVLAVVQRHSVKRMLAYSSVAHSGYMLVGLIAGPGDGTFGSSGLSAVLFYLLVYGVMNVGVFAVLSSLERTAEDGVRDEIDDIEDVQGLCRTRPMLGWVMVLSCAGLMGLPPLLGFFGKVPLFTSGIAAGQIVLVLVLGVNSAIAAFYYLRLIKAAMLDDAADRPNLCRVEVAPFGGRRIAGIASAVGVVVLIAFAGPLGDASAIGARVVGGGEVGGGRAALVEGDGVGGEVDDAGALIGGAALSSR